MSEAPVAADASPGPTLFLIAGEPSGDHLAAALMDALAALSPRPPRFVGVGGPEMAARGLVSLFPMDEIALVGIDEIVRRLPFLLRRIRETADAVVASAPDALVIVDAPDFTHRVARRVRRARPDLPVIDYVSPTVWAWRPGRARAMAHYVDLVLALLPFEPAVHRRLGGPPCVYVGHPALERLADVRARRAARDTTPGTGASPALLVLPGSRRQEIDRLLAPFGDAVALIARERPDLAVTIPAVDHLAERIARETAEWPVRPTIVRGAEAKDAAFAAADAALAASGTVTLELAIAGVPMVVAYRLDGAFRMVKRLNRVVPIVTARSMVLPNLVVGENAIPEFLDDAATPAALAAATAPLLREGPERARQRAALADLERRMALPDGVSPAGAAARAVLDHLGLARAA